MVDPDAGAAPCNVVPTVDASTVVASARGVSVTLGEVVARMRDLSGAAAPAYVNNPSAVRELVDRITTDRVLAAEARRRGLENDPIVRAAVERALIARLRATVLNPAADAVPPTDDDVRRWYDSHPERFHIPERRRARVIFFETQREAQDTLRFALVRRNLRYIHDFRRLAAERNTDPHLRSMGGDLRDVTYTPTPGGIELDPAVRAAVFEVGREGETLPRVVRARWHDRDGYFLVHMVSRRRPEERSLESQADWIRLRIVAERRVAAERAQIDALLRDAGLNRAAVERMVRFEPVVAAPMDAAVDGADASADR